MEIQTITLSLPKEILAKIKRIAVQRQTSVSGLLENELEKLVQQDEAYANARQRHLEWLTKGADLGTNGYIQTTRDKLHERS